ncbi:hypothetical protein H7F36_02880 [Variovorax sp. PAMC28562]|uniref:hypothetical protein n=1 Tax=Variovorax sp. PAMC28562 TaxID=2762323 RepID=UPI00164E1B87|nr:hypothetical protein [Variovorax sp. PAMC28562]QNK74209.1 hypothetical protein H7F36_02880 [Variovorax sp. PAMC28562]
MSVTQSNGPAVLKFSPSTTPSPLDPVDANDFYQALGIALVAWGRLEGHFTLMLLNLMRIAGAAAVTHQLPNSMAERARLWKIAVGACADLVGVHDVAIWWVNDLMVVAERRNTVVHAIWGSFVPSPTLAIEALSIRHKKKTPDGLEVTRQHVTIATLQEIATQANRLNISLLNFSGSLESLYPTPPDAQNV